jgi:hypothetical protein
VRRLVSSVLILVAAAACNKAEGPAPRTVVRSNPPPRSPDAGSPAARDPASQEQRLAEIQQQLVDLRAEEDRLIVRMDSAQTQDEVRLVEMKLEANKAAQREALDRLGRAQGRKPARPCPTGDPLCGI